MNEPAKSFCPQCQADWDRPWFDVCPACGHNFKSRPWWQSPWLVLALVCAPAVTILMLGLVPRDTNWLFGTNGPDDLLVGLALFGSGVTALPAAILLAYRLKASVLARVLLSLLFVPLFYAVSFCLCFFACGGSITGP